MASHFVVPSLIMKIFHVLPKKHPLKTEIVSKTFKKKALNKNNDLFSILLEKKTKLIIITTTVLNMEKTYICDKINEVCMPNITTESNGVE